MNAVIVLIVGKWVSSTYQWKNKDFVLFVAFVNFATALATLVTVLIIFKLGAHDVS